MSVPGWCSPSVLEADRSSAGACGPPESSAADGSTREWGGPDSRTGRPRRLRDRDRPALSGSDGDELALGLGDDRGDRGGAVEVEVREDAVEPAGQPPVGPAE